MSICLTTDSTTQSTTQMTVQSYTTTMGAGGSGGVISMLLVTEYNDPIISESGINLVKE